MMDNLGIVSIKFRFSKKATKNLTKSPSYLVNFKSTGKFCQIFVDFSEYLKFKKTCVPLCENFIMEQKYSNFVKVLIM